MSHVLTYKIKCWYINHIIIVHIYFEMDYNVHLNYLLSERSMPTFDIIS